MQPFTKRQLLARRGDLSPFLIHLTRTGKLKKWKDIENLPKEDFEPLQAKQSLKNILSQKKIQARSPCGYFNFKTPYERADRTINPNSQIHRKWLLAVCLTETPIDHVYLQCQQIEGRQLHFEPYGLAFSEEVVRKKGGNPIFYVDTANQGIRNSLDAIPISPICKEMKNMMPFVEGFGSPWFRSQYRSSEVDFRWEREWRVPGDIRFEVDDIAYGICPENEIKDFEEMTNHSLPFVDPTKHMELVKTKLRSYPKLAHLK